MKTVIEVKDLVKRYKELVALDHFALSIKEGEIFGLLGPNGSGKTTIIKLLCGLYQPTSGRILFDDCDLKNLSSSEIGKVIKVVFQDFFQFIHKGIHIFKLPIHRSESHIRHRIQIF